jgi:hypothetical protein
MNTSPKSMLNDITEEKVMQILIVLAVFYTTSSSLSSELPSPPIVPAAQSWP